MRSVVTDKVAWSFGLSVGQSVTLVSLEKWLNRSRCLPFGLRTQVVPGNHVLDWAPDSPMGRGNFKGKGATHCKVWGHSAVTCAKTAELIVMPRGLWAWTGPRNHELDGGSYPPMRMENFGERVAHC